MEARDDKFDTDLKVVMENLEAASKDNQEFSEFLLPLYEQYFEGRRYLLEQCFEWLAQVINHQIDLERQEDPLKVSSSVYLYEFSDKFFSTYRLVMNQEVNYFGKQFPEHTLRF
jgi:hypothetical protein